MGMSLKLLLLLVIAVAIISDDAQGQGQGRGGRCGLHADCNAAEARQPRDLAADVPQVNEDAHDTAESLIERLAKREKTP
ncbi:Hypp7834 [Branchiostoma lanceolatum]|uniref:Hypp7834 protein n=1 Tax=Branchiostoma lanceolatum TaxID=7740 RepID=A0A8J9Z3S0_BRALA|nr:Hypp7834 [Branchiostoma lanceolatum]